MADETDNPDIAADRLEAALERIAQAEAAPRAPEPTPAPEPSDTAAVAERLDTLIERVRDALDND